MKQNKPFLKLDIQFFGEGSKVTLFELQQNLVTIGQQLQKTEQELSKKAADPAATTEEIRALQSSKEDLRMRYNIIEKQKNEMEADIKEKLIPKEGTLDALDPKEKIVKAKADLIRATLRNASIAPDVRQALGDDSTTNGNKFLPKTVSNDIIAEPYVKNPLREISMVTQISNLELPKLAYTLDDDGFIQDKETAKELELTGSTVAFGRHKLKVFAGVSETILNGTDTNLVSHVERALQSGVAAKEKKVAFATSPASGEEHMSFYSTQNAIKKVAGKTKFEAILLALADLAEDYRENATIVMSYLDYISIIKDLSNGSTSLFGVQPEQVLGKPVVFIDAAKQPIVGDFSYSHFNYDIGILYERDKDVKTGIENFVLTAWFDHRIKLHSAFRIAEVSSGTPTV